MSRMQVSKRCSSTSEFAKVSLLLNLVCKMTEDLTFENVYEVGAVDDILKEKEVRKKEQVARLEAADMVKNALERALVCVCVYIYVYMYVRVCM